MDSCELTTVAAIVEQHLSMFSSIGGDYDCIVISPAAAGSAERSLAAHVGLNFV